MSVQEESVAEETEVLEPIAEVVAEPTAEEVPETEPEAAEVQPDPAPKKTPWFQRVIAEVREEKSQERQLREAAERRASDLQAIIERMQAGGEKPDPAAAKPAPPNQTEFQAAVKAQAAKDRFYEDTLVVKQTGQSKFKDFDESLGILTAIGATSDDFVADILAVDKDGAHDLIDKLAKDPEKAASLVSTDSRRRIAELTRMAVAPKTEEPKPAAEAPKPAAISRAPTPKPSISPLSAAPEIDPTTPEGNEKMSDKQFEQWYKGKYQKRA